MGLLLALLIGAVLCLPVLSMYWKEQERKQKKLNLQKKLLDAYDDARYVQDLPKMRKVVEEYCAITYSEKEREWWVNYMVKKGTAY